MNQETSLINQINFRLSVNVHIIKRFSHLPGLEIITALQGWRGHPYQLNEFA